jgi:hypothetical protein
MVVRARTHAVAERVAETRPPPSDHTGKREQESGPTSLARSTQRLAAERARSGSVTLRCRTSARLRELSPAELVLVTSRPPSSGSSRHDALLAAVVELVCLEREVRVAPMVQRTCCVPHVVGLSVALGAAPRARDLSGPVPCAGDHDRRVRCGEGLSGPLFDEPRSTARWRRSMRSFTADGSARTSTSLVAWRCCWPTANDPRPAIWTGCGSRTHRSAKPRGPPLELRRKNSLRVSRWPALSADPGPTSTTCWDSYLDDELATEARELGINVSEAARDGLRRAIRRSRGERDRQGHLSRPEVEDDDWDAAESLVEA